MCVCVYYMCVLEKVYKDSVITCVVVVFCRYGVHRIPCGQVRYEILRRQINFVLCLKNTDFADDHDVDIIFLLSFVWFVVSLATYEFYFY